MLKNFDFFILTSIVHKLTRTNLHIGQRITLIVIKLNTQPVADDKSNRTKQILQTQNSNTYK